MDALVLDLDGTLLNSDKKVSGRNLRALKEVIKRDIPMIIATARPPRSVKQMLPEEIRSSAFMVYYNGALIDGKSLNIHYHFSIDSKISTDIIKYLIETEPQHCLSIEAEDHWYSYQDLDFTKTMQITSNPEKITLKALKKINPTKILVSHLDSPLSLGNKLASQVTIITTDSNQLTQIMKHNISKEFAVSLLSEKLGLSLDQVVVFGDDFNDLGLFKCCGYPVAMKNAVPELKQLAAEVTDSNDQDGVAKTLEHLLG
ncbi:HAD family phosphatase [Sporolactobacillus shoreae]|uniref:HAD family phosphatase n=1 Tax=Sporolactobacillus shoreae TaxID=1465501 RepID=A0A4Z0GMW3_9BACL|nr:Cof-type HAD-IIB family hydrolase [Sporolactobacillus shoreae]TGA98174.1 HAD family phosphatase [Sporolactobacillus shoreae]